MTEPRCDICIYEEDDDICKHCFNKSSFKGRCSACIRGDDQEDSICRDCAIGVDRFEER